MSLAAKELIVLLNDYQQFNNKKATFQTRVKYLMVLARYIDFINMLVLKLPQKLLVILKHIASLLEIRKDKVQSKWEMGIHSEFLISSEGPKTNCNTEVSLQSKGRYMLNPITLLHKHI